MVKDKRYWKLAAPKFKLKILLYRMKLLFLSWEIKERVKRDL